MERARTDEAKEDKRLGLLEAAVGVFFEQGFAATRMDDIAARAGVSKGTLYLYFKSKEDLFVGLIEAFAQPNMEQLERAVRSAPSAREALSALVSFMPYVIRETPMPVMAKVLIGDASRFPEAAKRYRTEVFDRIIGVVTGILERGRKSGEFELDNAALTARLVVAPVLLTAIWSVVFAPLDRTDQIDVDALFALHEKNLIRALTPQEDPV